MAMSFDLRSSRLAILYYNRLYTAREFRMILRNSLAFSNGLIPSFTRTALRSTVLGSFVFIYNRKIRLASALAKVNLIFCYRNCLPGRISFTRDRPALPNGRFAFRWHGEDSLFPADLSFCVWLSVPICQAQQQAPFAWSQDLLSLPSARQALPKCNSKCHLGTLKFPNWHFGLERLLCIPHGGSDFSIHAVHRGGKAAKDAGWSSILFPKGRTSIRVSFGWSVCASRGAWWNARAFLFASRGSVQGAAPLALLCSYPQ